MLQDYGNVGGKVIIHKKYKEITGFSITTMIYTYVLNLDGHGILTPVDLCCQCV
jgi:hypothetical protein